MNEDNVNNVRELMNLKQRVRTKVSRGLSWEATLNLRRVTNMNEYGVVMTDSRIW